MSNNTSDTVERIREHLEYLDEIECYATSTMLLHEALKLIERLRASQADDINAPQPEEKPTRVPGMFWCDRDDRP